MSVNTQAPSGSISDGVRPAADASLRATTAAECWETNVRYWKELVEDPRWADVPYQIETNRWGEMVMHPPPLPYHQTREKAVERTLERLLGDETHRGLGLSTADGVKQLDACWVSPERFATYDLNLPLPIAPEICVEILSPSNRPGAMRHKRVLYFDAGATECWECDLEARMHFYTDPARPDEASERSTLCPEFPRSVRSDA